LPRDGREGGRKEGRYLSDVCLPSVDNLVVKCVWGLLCVKQNTRQPSQIQVPENNQENGASMGIARGGIRQRPPLQGTQMHTLRYEHTSLVAGSLVRHLAYE